MASIHIEDQSKIKQGDSPDTVVMKHNKASCSNSTYSEDGDFETEQDEEYKPEVGLKGEMV